MDPSMEFTKQFLRSKSPCAMGFRWFVRNIEDGVSYQKAIDTLVQAGRIDDALWLVENFGPTNAVLQLDHLEGEALVFAGTVEVRGGVEVDGIIHVGRSLHVGGGIRCGGNMFVGEEIRAGATIFCGGKLQCGGRLRTDWGVDVQGSMAVGGDLRVGWDAVAQGAITVQGAAVVGQCRVATRSPGGRSPGVCRHRGGTRRR